MRTLRALSVLLMTATATAALSSPAAASNATRFAAAVQAAGNPRDQVERLLRAGIVLQERQLVASAMARLCDADGGPTEVAYGGARGGGKSHWAIAQLTDDCLRYPGLKCLLLRKVGKANKENFQDLRTRVLPGVRTAYNKTEGTLTFANGSVIKTGHFQNDRDIDAYLGLEYDVILIEEATTLTKSKVDDILSCLRTSKPDWRPRAYLTTNPGNVGHAWFKARFLDPWRRGAESDTRFVQATVKDNRFVDPGYKGKLERLTGWKRRAWLFGDWDIAAGQYFTTWRNAVHVRAGLRAEPHWRIWLALDYGFAHYTACYLLGEDGDGTVHVLDEHAERGWLVDAHCEAIRAMLARNGVEEHRVEAFVAGGDVFRRESDGARVADDYARHGFTLQRANMGRTDGAAEFLRRLGDVDRDPPIRPSLYVADRCSRLIACLPGLMHDANRGEDVKKVDCDDDGFGGDDFYDAVRYGLMHVAGGRAVNAITDDDWDIYRGD